MRNTFAKTLPARTLGADITKGSLDCSANPNYPVGVSGDRYKVSVAGKIGGASGVTVEVGDVIECLVDNAGGTQASVGTSWFVLQANLVGAVTGGASSTDNAIARYDGTTGKIIQNSGATVDDSGNLAANNISGTSSGTNTGDQDLSVLMPIPLYLGSNVDSTLTSFVHTLDQTVASGRVYSFRMEIPVTADAVGGLKVGVFLDLDPEALEAQIEIINNTAQTLAASKRIVAKADAGTASTYLSVTGATSYFVKIWGTVFNPSGTTLALALAQAAANGTTSALKGATSQMSDLGGA